MYHGMLLQKLFSHAKESRSKKILCRQKITTHLGPTVCQEDNIIYKYYSVVTNILTLVSQPSYTHKQQVAAIAIFVYKCITFRYVATV